MKSNRLKLILLYENQLPDEGEFMTLVLTEAIRKLRDTNLPIRKIENWVIKLEKTWGTI